MCSGKAVCEPFPAVSRDAWHDLKPKQTCKQHALHAPPTPPPRMGSPSASQFIRPHLASILLPLPSQSWPCHSQALRCSRGHTASHNLRHFHQWSVQRRRSSGGSTLLHRTSGAHCVCHVSIARGPFCVESLMRPWCWGRGLLAEGVWWWGGRQVFSKHPTGPVHPARAPIMSRAAPVACVGRAGFDVHHIRADIIVCNGCPFLHSMQGQRRHHRLPNPECLHCGRCSRAWHMVLVCCWALEHYYCDAHGQGEHCLAPHQTHHTCPLKKTASSQCLSVCMQEAPTASLSPPAGKMNTHQRRPPSGYPALPPPSLHLKVLERA